MPDEAPQPADPVAQRAVEAAELPGNYFELYKLAVEMADRISARRGTANTFFLTVNTGPAALLGSTEMRWYVAVAGVAFCATWWALLKSYRDLNKAKFEIILAMEERLPVRVYADEWDRLKKTPSKAERRRDAARAWVAQYRELGRVERLVPIVFVLIYLVELIRQVTT
jgi:hypothetical protein